MLSQQWLQRLIEGGVIVVSILLAFAIDAWWDRHQEYEQHTQRMVRVAAELRANSRRVELKQGTLTRSISATSTLMSWMGPVPDTIDFDLYAELDTQSLSVGTFSLLRRATDAYLSSANLSSGDDDGIRDLIDEWHRRGDNLELQYKLMRDAHAGLTSYTTGLGLIPVRKAMQGHRVMGDHPESRFPVDLPGYFSNPVVENHYAIYLIRLEFVSEQLERFDGAQSDLLAALEIAIDHR